MLVQSCAANANKEEKKLDTSNTHRKPLLTRKDTNSRLSSPSTGARMVIGGTRGRVLLAGSGATTRSSSRNTYIPADDEKSTRLLVHQNQKSLAESTTESTRKGARSTRKINVNEM